MHWWIYAAGAVAVIALLWLGRAVPTAPGHTGATGCTTSKSTGESTSASKDWNCADRRATSELARSDAWAEGIG